MLQRGIPSGVYSLSWLRHAYCSLRDCAIPWPCVCSGMLRLHVRQAEVGRTKSATVVGQAVQACVGWQVVPVQAQRGRALLGLVLQLAAEGN